MIKLEKGLFVVSGSELDNFIDFAKLCTKLKEKYGDEWFYGVLYLVCGGDFVEE